VAVSKEAELRTYSCLANGVEFIHGVVLKIAGEEISTDIGGVHQSGAALADTIAAKMQASLATSLN
jgi:hypothetical protein